MIHSDQSNHALQAAHQVQHGLCAFCGESYGWWQGINLLHEDTPQWACAGCAALCRVIPPPDGVMSFYVHNELLDELGLPRYDDPVETARRLAPSGPYLLAWALETDSVINQAMTSEGKLIPKRLEREWAAKEVRNRHMSRLLFPKPGWWIDRIEPEPWIYIKSQEEDLLFQIIQRVIEPEELRIDWDRHWFAEGSSSAGAWTWQLPDSHPKRSEGFIWVSIFPWHQIKRRALREKIPTEGFLFTRALAAQVEEGFKSALQALVIPPEEPLPPFWESAGIPGAFRG